jgi:hypothetical protein
MRPLALFLLLAACVYPRKPAGDERPLSSQPERDGTVAVRTIDGHRVEIDRRRQVLSVELSDKEESDRRDGKEELLTAFLPTFGVSASALAAKAKQFDDGLYAAVDLAAQSGAGAFSGKGALLSSLAAGLRSAEPGEATVTIFSAAKLGGIELDLPGRAQGAVEQRIGAFRADERISKPLAFYTWSPRLAAIFQQDRMLQQPTKDAAGVEAIARLIHADGRLRAAYQGYLDLTARLTNPRSSVASRDLGEDLRETLRALDDGHFLMPAAGMSFFPPSRSHEADLVKQLYGTGPIPEGFSLIDELIRRIRSGSLNLAPREDSGWYDHQTWALESLVIPERMPEAAHLRLGGRYRGYLLDLFRAILALTRETHVKQLESPGVGAAPPGRTIVIDIAPELSAEPLPTYYRRRALSYAFVRTVVAKTFGAEALRQMHRLTAAGPVAANLDEELRSMETIFLGAYATVSGELGMAPEPSPELGTGSPGGDSAAFEEWASSLYQDPDLGQDIRMMVPLFFDKLRGKTKVLAVLGWATRQAQIGFATPPSAVVLDLGSAKQADVRFHFRSRTMQLAYPVSVEIYVDRILDRDEFRKLCEEHRTQAKILQALQSKS